MNITESTKKVVVVTVTYGKRFNLLSRLMTSLESLKVGALVVVDNGGATVGSEEFKILMASSPYPVLVSTRSRNEGSAAGFAIGLEVARTQTDAAYAWLMDDDNVPSPDSLNVLLRQHEVLSQREGRPVAVVAYRPAQTRQQRLVSGEAPESVFPRHSSFLEFDVRDFPQKIARRLKGGPAVARPPEACPDVIELPFAPYGGLLLPFEIMDAVGVPDASLFVYWDDGEYTNRIRRRGFGLYLVPKSTVADIDDSWGVAVKGQNVFRRLLTAASAFRVYYSVRNQALFCERHWTSNTLMFSLNRITFIGFLILFGVWMRRFRRLGLLMRAVQDGRSARLGEVETITLQ